MRGWGVLRTWWRRRRGPAAPHAISPLSPAPAHPIDFTPEAPADRLVRLARWCTDGRLAGAELELHEWQRCDYCPAAARTLLAALLARRGAVDDALGILRRGDHPRCDPDAELTQLHVALLTSAGLLQTAADLVVRLHHSDGDDPGIAAWVQTMQVGPAGALPGLSDRQIAQLAAELTVNPQVIPALVAAQKILPIASDVHLLRRAIEQLIHEVHDDDPRMLVVCQALADLALLADDADDARRWAHRGLRLNPFSAPLALVLAQFPDDTALGPPADQVLEGAIQAHPAYPDLRAALVRRELQRGRGDRARLLVAHWLRA